jgi:hypothetical protein
MILGILTNNLSPYQIGRNFTHAQTRRKHDAHTAQAPCQHTGMNTATRSTRVSTCSTAVANDEFNNKFSDKFSDKFDDEFDDNLDEFD